MATQRQTQTHRHTDTHTHTHTHTQRERERERERAQTPPHMGHTVYGGLKADLAVSTRTPMRADPGALALLRTHTKSHTNSQLSLSSQTQNIAPRQAISARCIGVYSQRQGTPVHRDDAHQHEPRTVEHLASVTLAVVLAEGRPLALSTMAPLAFVLAY